MIPITTLKILDMHMGNVKRGVKKDPKKYTYTYNVLKQLRTSILLEYQVQNKQLLN
jgi:hypothetical protein